MPQIAQQDYKIIAPKEGRAFGTDAAALGELKRSILNGTVFDCLLKDILPAGGTIDRVLGFYEGGFTVSCNSVGEGSATTFELTYTIEQYEGLSAVQLAEDEHKGYILDFIPTFEVDGTSLMVTSVGDFICVDGKFLTVTASSDSKIEALAIGENVPAGESFINITWEDAQKLIGLPLE